MYVGSGLGVYPKLTDNDHIIFSLVWRRYEWIDGWGWVSMYVVVAQ